MILLLSFDGVLHPEYDNEPAPEEMAFCPLGRFKAAVAGGLRRHHALDDAKANRLGWIAAGGDIERAPLL